ncbi:MAG: hypothetical protein ACRD2B_08120 [Terriglobia bacterium]
MRRRKLSSGLFWVLCFGVICLSFQCGGGGGGSGIQPSPPSGPTSPGTLSSISPIVAAQNGPQFTLTANGSNFPSSAQIVFNGTAESTTLVNSTQLTAAIPSSALSTAGKLNVTVQAGTTNSSAVSFYVVPAVSPSSVSVGSAATTSSVDVSVSADTQTTPLLLQSIGASVGSEATSAANTAIVVEPGQTVNLFVVGSGIQAGDFFSVTGNGDITVTQPIVSNFSQTEGTSPVPAVNFNISVSPSAALGPRSLMVTDPAGEISVFPGGIIVQSGS